MASLFSTHEALAPTPRNHAHGPQRMIARLSDAVNHAAVAARAAAAAAAAAAANATASAVAVDVAASAAAVASAAFVAVAGHTTLDGT